MSEAVDDNDDAGIFGESEETQQGAEVVEFPNQPNKTKEQLICIADNTGNPLVAKAKYDNKGELGLVENYRRPTQQEWLHLQQTGKVVKQGTQTKPFGNDTPTQQSSFTLPKWAKYAGIGLGVVGVAGGAYFLLRNSRNKNPTKPPLGREIDYDNDDDFDDDDDEE